MAESLYFYNARNLAYICSFPVFLFCFLKKGSCSKERKKIKAKPKKERNKKKAKCFENHLGTKFIPIVQTNVKIIDKDSVLVFGNIFT